MEAHERHIGSEPTAVGVAPLLLKIGLILTVALLGAGILDPAAATIGVALHILLRIYDGRFSGWRRTTWLLLVIGCFLSFAIGFLGYVLPLGQLSFWLAAHLGEAGWRMARTVVVAPPLIGACVWLALAADMIALHAAGLSRRRVLRNFALLVLVFVTPGVVSDILHITGMIHSPAAIGDPLSTPRKIVPDIGGLPLFAILRAVPDKGLGVVVVILVLLLPVAAAWSRAWRFHAPPTRLIWTLATTALAANWVALGIIGSRPPDDGLRWTVFALIAYHVAFFIALPPVLACYARHTDRRIAVFD